MKIRIAKIRQRLSALKLGPKLRLLKKGVKPLKHLLPVIALIYPLNSYAVEIVNKVDENRYANTNSPTFRHLAISLLGLSKCSDPCLTSIQKIIYCARPCCLIAGLTSGYVSKSSPFGSRVHKLSSLCCASSWSAYTFLVFLDPEKLEIKKNK
jgi:hypothetical protein